jgi:hypothetical protein
LPQICGKLELVLLLASRELPLTRFLLEQRFQSSRYQGPLALGEVAAMQVPESPQEALARAGQKKPWTRAKPARI